MAGTKSGKKRTKPARASESASQAALGASGAKLKKKAKQKPQRERLISRGGQPLDTADSACAHTAGASAEAERNHDSGANDGQAPERPGNDNAESRAGIAKASEIDAIFQVAKEFKKLKQKRKADEEEEEEDEDEGGNDDREERARGSLPAGASKGRGGKKGAFAADPAAEAAKGSSRGGEGPRRRTAEGYKIYSETELNWNKKDAGNTDLCPFDCDCCF